MEGKCIIVCAGRFSGEPIEKEEGDLLIAADNGLTYLSREGLIPDLAIGDYDSLEEEGKRVLAAIQKDHPERVITLPVEKDDTDTLAAVREGFRRGYRSFVLYGALGGRLDHTMANLQTLNFIKDAGGNGEIREGDLSVFLVRNETVEIPAGPAGNFALFAVDPEIHGVTERGMQYEADGMTITNRFPIGCSNRLLAEKKASVTVKDGTALAMLTRSVRG
ncbi:MAG: thiamine diphosphokinase [Lachnospiraceae bacterium]